MTDSYHGADTTSSVTDETPVYAPGLYSVEGEQGSYTLAPFVPRGRGRRPKGAAVYDAALQALYRGKAPEVAAWADSFSTTSVVASAAFAGVSGPVDPADAAQRMEWAVSNGWTWLDTAALAPAPPKAAEQVERPPVPDGCWIVPGPQREITDVIAQMLSSSVLVFGGMVFVCEGSVWFRAEANAANAVLLRAIEACASRGVRWSGDKGAWVQWVIPDRALPSYLTEVRLRLTHSSAPWCDPGGWVLRDTVISLDGSSRVAQPHDFILAEPPGSKDTWLQTADPSEVIRYLEDGVGESDAPMFYSFLRDLALRPVKRGKDDLPIEETPFGEDDPRHGYIASPDTDDRIQAVLAWLGLTLVQRIAQRGGRGLVLFDQLGGAGKSEFAALVGLLFPARARGCVDPTDDGRFAAAGLLGKAINQAPDLKSSERWSDGIFKQAVHGEEIKLELKGKDQTEFFPTAGWLVTTNFPLYLGDDPGPLVRRLLVFPTDGPRWEEVGGVKRNLAQTIVDAEGHAIVALALQAAREALSHPSGLSIPVPASSDATLSRWAASGGIVDFVETHLELSPKPLAVLDIWQAYNFMQQEHGVMKRMTYGAFTQRFGKAAALAVPGVQSRRKADGVLYSLAWTGIGEDLVTRMSIASTTGAARR